MQNVIDLRSDTKTLPSDAMRRAMATAAVGDEQLGEDPSVNALCSLVAGLVGKDDAIFVPSGTMCNQITVGVFCRPGDEVVADSTSHLLNMEAGGAAAIAGVQIRPVFGRAGVFAVRDVAAISRGYGGYASPAIRMISIEQTANLGGGTVWPLPHIQELAAFARANSIAMSMDGARLLNATVASGISCETYSQCFDSVWIDLSKGLGCPVGAVLCGSRAFIAEAKRWKQRLGGAMRQAGILAAAGIFAMENNVHRLAEDHENAVGLAGMLAEFPVLGVKRKQVETNIILIRLDPSFSTADEFCKLLADRGLRLGVIDEFTVRAVTHLGISKDDVTAAADIIGRTVHSISAGQFRREPDSLPQ